MSRRHQGTARSNVRGSKQAFSCERCGARGFRPTLGAGQSRTLCASCQAIADEIGPRQVGGRYHCGYWGQDYKVLAIEIDPKFIGGWEISVKWDDGRITHHSTAWNARRDRVLS